MSRILCTALEIVSFNRQEEEENLIKRMNHLLKADSISDIFYPAMVVIEY